MPPPATRPAAARHAKLASARAPVKTDKARAALAQRDNGLTPRARQMLVICDGLRDSDSLLRLFGSDGEPTLNWLLREGFLLLPGLAEAPPTPAPPPDMSRASAAPSAGAPSPANRRSLAASRRYLLDMLQMLQDPNAAQWLSTIQASRSDEQLCRQLLGALRWMAEHTETSYAGRVAERLQAMLPDEHQPALRLLRAELFDAA